MDAVREMDGDEAAGEAPDFLTSPPNMERREATLAGAPSSSVDAPGREAPSVATRASSGVPGAGAVPWGLLEREGGGGGGAFLIGGGRPVGLGSRRGTLADPLVRVGLGGDCFGVGGKSA